MTNPNDVAALPLGVVERQRWFVRDLRASTMAAMGWVGPSIDTILIVDRSGDEIVEGGGDNCVVARIRFDNRTEPLGDSNMDDARLIAAAPDLLEALISTRESLRAMADEGIVAEGSWPMIDAAIARATGASQ